MKDLSPETFLIHGIPAASKDIHDALRPPVYEAAAFEYDNAENMEAAFAGELPHHSYSRSSNPTVSELEKRLQLLSGADHVLALSSGMAALSNLTLLLCRPGDNVLVSPYLFGNTLSFFHQTLKELAIEARTVDTVKDPNWFQKADENSRLLFVESASNPLLNTPDIKALSKTLQNSSVLLVVDNTLLTPLGLNCRESGADVEILSLTKNIAPGGTALGGAIMIYPSSKWQKNPKLSEKWSQLGSATPVKMLRKFIFRNLGACMSPQAANLHLLGIETLPLRLKKASDNTRLIADALIKDPRILSLNQAAVYPSNAAFPGNSLFTPPLISFELKDRPAAFCFLNALKLIRRATNICENKTLALHPASTIHREFSEKQLQLQLISDKLIRLAVGIENPDDLLSDLKQALDHSE